MNFIPYESIRVTWSNITFNKNMEAIFNSKSKRFLQHKRWRKQRKIFFKFNNTVMTVNADDVSDITIADSLHKDVVRISEQLRNIQAEHHSKYWKCKRNKDTNTEKLLDTPSHVTPVTQKDNLPSDNTSNKWPQGTVCIAEDIILTLSWRTSLSYRNHSIDLEGKSMDWFLCDRDLRHEKIKWNKWKFTLPKAVSAWTT